MKKFSSYILVLLLTLAVCIPVSSQDYPSTGYDPDGPGNPSLSSLVMTVLPGNNSTSGNGRAPQGSRRFINTKYIITGAEMTASGFTGMVNSVGWRWNVPSPPAAAAPTSQSIATTGNLRVYVKDTTGSALTFGGTFIDTNGVGYTKIIDGTISIPTGLSEINIDVPVGGPGTGPYTPTPGSGVLLIFVYKTTNTTLATPLGSPTCFCTNVGTGTKLLTYQSNTVGGSTGGASTFRPETRFGAVPFTDDMGVNLITANPLSPACSGTTEIFTARVRNYGTNTQPAGVPVVLSVDGSPVETKFTTISLPEDATENITFTGLILSPGNHVIKSYTQLAGDLNPGNDTTTVPYTVISSVSIFPYLQTFTNPVGWSTSGNASLWILQPGLTNAAGKVSDTAVRCNFFNITAGNSAILKSPPFDFTAVSHPVIHWYTAYRSFTTEDDSMQVLISTDCGVTFVDAPVPYRKANTSVPSLATRNPSTTSFIPDSSRQWRHETIDLAAYAGNSNVIIGFRGRSAFGNNLYVDNFIATDADGYCASAVSAPGPYSCDPLLSVDFTTVGLRAGNIAAEIFNLNQVKSVELNSGTLNPFAYSSFNPVIIGGNNLMDNPSGGDLSVTRHSNSYPPSIASPEIAPNATATTNDGSIYTPDIIHSNNWFTTTYTGQDRAGYPLYNISIDLGSLPFADKIYIVKRADMTGSWVCLNTTRSGSILTASGVDIFCDYALASSCPFPATPSIEIVDLNPGVDTLTCGGVLTIPGHNGSHQFMVIARGEPGEIITLSEIHELIPPDCKTIEINPPLPITQSDSIVVTVTVTRTDGNLCTGFMRFTCVDECLFPNEARCTIGFDNPLPVELSSFVSSINGRDVSLNWSTSAESNNSGFDVERTVVNGVWTKIGFVQGNGTTNETKNYSFTDRSVSSGKYNYRLKQIDFNGNFEYFNLSNEVNVGVPEKFELSQNYPNPFNPSTKINYDLPFDGKVSLKIYNMSGKEVATLVNEVKTAGYHTFTFNASGLSSGVYFYKIVVEGNGNNFVAAKKMILIK